MSSNLIARSKIFQHVSALAAVSPRRGATNHNLPRTPHWAACRHRPPPQPAFGGPWPRTSPSALPIHRSQRLDRRLTGYRCAISSGFYSEPVRLPRQWWFRQLRRRPHPRAAEASRACGRASGIGRRAALLVPTCFVGRRTAVRSRRRSDARKYSYDQARERSLFGAFKRAARPFVPAPLANDWEWLALAQHHGEPTRLVDWSTSPLVAAWFATTSYPHDTDAVVFALDLSRDDLSSCDVATGKTSDGVTIHDPLEPKAGVFLVEIAPVSPRITTQRGIFTAHGSPTTPFPVADADRFIIPKALRSDFKGQLLDDDPMRRMSIPILMGSAGRSTGGYGPARASLHSPRYASESG